MGSVLSQKWGKNEGGKRVEKKEAPQKKDRWGAWEKEAHMKKRPGTMRYDGWAGGSGMGPKATALSLKTMS